MKKFLKKGVSRLQRALPSDVVLVLDIVSGFLTILCLIGIVLIVSIGIYTLATILALVGMVFISIAALIYFLCSEAVDVW